MKLGVSIPHAGKYSSPENIVKVAQRAEALGVRVVLVRTGLVLSAEGGFLSRLLLPFKLGLGGPLGNGRQWMPWIHIDDQIALIDFLLHRDQASGPYNACAPKPVRNREFAKTLGSVLHRPAFMPMPALALKVALGEFATEVLGSSRVLPAALTAAGFTFTHPDIDSATRALVTP